MSVIVRDYFQIRMRIIGISIPDEALEVFMLSKEIDYSQEIENFSEADKIFAEIVLMILATPDISEDDYSIKYDRNAIKEWYAAECARLGIPNLLSKGSFPVRDMSHLA